MQRTFAGLFLGILANHADDRLLCIATAICLPGISLTQVVMAKLAGCADRHIRYLQDR
jgi:hypothetical protein